MIEEIQIILTIEEAKLLARLLGKCNQTELIKNKGFTIKEAKEIIRLYYKLTE